MTDDRRTAGAARRFWLRQASWRGMALVAAISLLMGIVPATAAWSEQGPTEAVKGTVSDSEIRNLPIDRFKIRLSEGSIHLRETP
jgi:hypothetical protein